MPPPPSKSKTQEHPPNDSPSLNLWVGDLHPETTDADLMSVFKEFGALDALTTYFPRTYAFVFFRNLEDSKRAKDALQASFIKESKIKIQFARPAKPGKHIWIGGISSSITEEQLETELLQFGKIEDYKFIRDRNSAIVGYFNLDHAIAAQKSMNGKSLGGDQLRVDFQKPHTQKPQSSRQDLPDNMRGGRNMGIQDGWMGANELTDQGSNRRLPHGGQEDPPCNTLHVSYPSSVRVDENMLHNAMILFGEINHIKHFPGRQYCFVEFRSVDEARRAKEGLQGRLFNDPRIQVKYATSERTQSRDNAPLLPGYRGSKPEIFINESPLRPTELLGHTYLGNCRPGPSLLTRPRSAHGFNPHSSALGMRPRTGPIPNVWDDGSDARDSKRSRFNGSLPNEVPFNESNQSLILREPRRMPSSDIWHGTIAKGGSHVCYARCVPLGNSLESPLPEVVNCFAKTDLITLTNKFDEASGFDAVYFYPNSEEDFASYTEFLQYLSSNDRVGVAKCEDGTVLFLVPPSNFLTDVLNINGPARLYGVVLKLPRQPVPQLQQNRNIEQRQEYNSQNDFISVHANDDSTLTPDQFSSVRESSRATQTYSVASGTHGSTSNSQVSLTPEIVATFASLIPSSNHASTPVGNNLPLISSVQTASSFNANGVHDHQPAYTASQLESRVNNTPHQPQQYGGQYSMQQSVVSQYPAYNNSVQPQNILQVSAAPTGHFGTYAPSQTQSFSSSQCFQQYDSSYEPYNASSYTQCQAATMLQNQLGSNAEYSGQMQNEQVVLNGGSDNDVERNQRYQSTLLLAASLLQQVQQQQQNGGGGNQL